MKTLTTYNDLITLSKFLQLWNGRMTNRIRTTNRHIASGNGSHLINSVVIKQLFTYDYPAYLTAEKIGYTFDYQVGTITIQTGKKNTLTVTLYNKVSKKVEKSNLNKSNLKKWVVNHDKVVNHDFIDVLQAVMERVLDY